jgi:hypothetical protein
MTCVPSTSTGICEGWFLYFVSGKKRSSQEKDVVEWKTGVKKDALDLMWPLDFILLNAVTSHSLWIIT